MQVDLRQWGRREVRRGRQGGGGEGLSDRTANSNRFPPQRLEVPPALKSESHFSIWAAALHFASPDSRILRPLLPSPTFKGRLLEGLGAPAGPASQTILIPSNPQGGWGSPHLRISVPFFLPSTRCCPRMPCPSRSPSCYIRA